MLDDRAIMLQSFGHTVDLLESLLYELPNNHNRQRIQ
jgi:hypothetical protein